MKYQKKQVVTKMCTCKDV